MLNDSKREIINYNNNSEEKSKDNYINKKGYLITGLIFIIIILSGLFISVYLSRKYVIFKSEASGSSLKRTVSIDNSYIFASPLKAKADNNERIRVTIFVLDSEGMGVYGKEVTLGNNNILNIKAQQQITDSLGRAIFDINSSRMGVFRIEASIDGKILSQKVEVTFE